MDREEFNRAKMLGDMIGGIAMEVSELTPGHPDLTLDHAWDHFTKFYEEGFRTGSSDVMPAIFMAANQTTGKSVVCMLTFQDERQKRKSVLTIRAALSTKLPMEFGIFMSECWIRRGSGEMSREEMMAIEPLDAVSMIAMVKGAAEPVVRSRAIVRTPQPDGSFVYEDTSHDFNSIQGQMTELLTPFTQEEVEALELMHFEL